jgi:hypothetical protein
MTGSGVVVLVVKFPSPKSKWIDMLLVFVRLMNGSGVTVSLLVLVQLIHGLTKTKLVFLQIK